MAKGLQTALITLGTFAGAYVGTGYAFENDLPMLLGTAIGGFVGGASTGLILSAFNACSEAPYVVVQREKINY